MVKEWNEHIYIEGGPEWVNGCTGRGDLILLRAANYIDLYPNSGTGCQRYIRTTRTWISSLYGTVHTVFEHLGPVV